MALHGRQMPAGSNPENLLVERRQAELKRSMKRAGLGVAAGIVAATATLWWLKSRK